jgi:hypothetical protein
MIAVMSKEMDEAVCDTEGAMVRVRPGASGSPLASKTGPNIADEGYRNSTSGTDRRFCLRHKLGCIYICNQLDVTVFSFFYFGNSTCFGVPCPSSGVNLLHG